MKNIYDNIITAFQKLRTSIFYHRNGKMGFFLERDGETATRNDLEECEEIDKDLYEKYKDEFNTALMNEDKPEDGIR